MTWPSKVFPLRAAQPSSEHQEKSSQTARRKVVFGDPSDEGHAAPPPPMQAPKLEVVLKPELTSSVPKLPPLHHEAHTPHAGPSPGTEGSDEEDHHRTPSPKANPEAARLGLELLSVVKRGDLVNASKIISMRPDLDVHDPSPEGMGCTALHYAVLRGTPVFNGIPNFPESVVLPLVEMLLEAGAHINATDQMGCTALHIAAAQGMDEVVAELLSRGAFMDVQDHQIKYTPFHAAAAAGKVGALLLMIQAGALVDEQVASMINNALCQDDESPVNQHVGTSALHAAKSAADLTVARSALSTLQKGRTGTVLPNGGGRLWALKDVTGLGIWDVLDTPATACGVLDVLLQDLAHVDLLGSRSLVQLLQQTQSLRYVTTVAQAAMGNETRRANLATSDVASQLDAVKNHLAKMQQQCHHQALRHPHRGRMPLPTMRPAILGRDLHSKPVDRERSSTGMRRVKLVKAGSVTRRRNNQRKRSSSSCYLGDEDNSASPLATPFKGDGSGNSGHAGSPTTRPSMDAKDRESATSYLTSQTSARTSQHTSLHTSTSSRITPQSLGVLIPQRSRRASSFASDRTGSFTRIKSRHRSVELPLKTATSETPPNPGFQFQFSVQDGPERARSAEPGPAPGPIGEGAEHEGVHTILYAPEYQFDSYDSSDASSDAQETVPAWWYEPQGPGLPVAESNDPPASPSRQPTSPTPNLGIAKRWSTMQNRALTGILVKKDDNANSDSFTKSGRQKSRVSCIHPTFVDAKPTKPAPPGFRVWTVTIENRLDECVRCIQWQFLKLEQYVEAIVTLARDTPSAQHLTESGFFKQLAEPIKNNSEAEDDSAAGVELIWEVVRQSITLGDRLLGHILVDRLVWMFPRALLRCPWATVMVDMCQAFPEVFHHLLCCLKDVTDDVRTAFVTSFNLADLEKKMANDRKPSLRQLLHVTATPNESARNTQEGISREAKSQHGSDKVAGSLVKRSAVSVSLANRVGSFWTGPSQSLDLYSPAKEDAASFKYTLYRNLVAGLIGVDYTLMKCFVENLDKGVLMEMAQMSVYKDFVALLPSKLVTRQGGGPDVIHEEMDSDKVTPTTGSVTTAKAAAAAVRAAAAGSGNLQNSGALGSDSRKPSTVGLSGGSTGGQAVRLAMRRQLRASMGKSTLGGAGPAVNETKAEVLHVERLLSAALAARSAESVQAGVESLVAWVEMNARNKRLCFIDGLNTQLVSQMALHFPTAAAALFNINPQASRDIKVSSMLLGKSPMSFNCSQTRYSFMWRQAELDDLDARGYSIQQVEQLADHNMRFMFICRAAQQGCSVEDILELMDLGLMGNHIADLVSSGARLQSVKDALEEGLSPDLLSSMLNHKLSWQLVEVLLNHRVTRTTVEDRTLRMDLLQLNTADATQHQGTFSLAFVSRFLEKWADAKWDKAFLDKVFHSSDTLCTKLKTAYDYKLSMRSNYVTAHASSLRKGSVLDWRRMLTILWAFAQPRWVLSRYITSTVFLLLLIFVEAIGSISRAASPLRAQEHTVDATAKVLPVINAASLGDKSLLAGLMYADVPSSWYGTPVARAVIAVQWEGFAQVLMALHLLEHIILMVLYGVLLFLLHQSMEEQQQKMLFDGTPVSELGTYVVDPDNPRAFDPYPYGDFKIHRKDVSESGLALTAVSGLLLFSICILITRLHQLKRAGVRLWSTHLANHADVICSFFCLGVVGAVFMNVNYDSVLTVGAAGVLFMFLRLTLFASIFERMGSLVRVVTEIMKDLRYFFVLIAIIYGGFAFAFSVQLGGQTNYKDVLLQLFTTMTGDFQADMLMDLMSNPGLWLEPDLALALWIIYGFMVGIVLVALLISIMNDTFDRIKDAEEVEVLRNKARMIVDLHTLMPYQAMSALQAAALGPFLHTLNAGQPGTSGTALGKMDEWQGRMQQIRNAVRMELHHVKGHRKSQLDAEEQGEFHKELTDLQAAVKAMRSDIQTFAKAMTSMQSTGPIADQLSKPLNPKSSVTLLPPRGSSIGISNITSISELIKSAQAILGPATDLLQDTSMSTGPKTPQSPAVAAALEGRTMLREASLPGRYFSREIPSTRGNGSTSTRSVWKMAAKLSLGGSKKLVPQILTDSPTQTAAGPDLRRNSERPSAVALRSLFGAGSSSSNLKEVTVGQGTASQSGLLTRFAVHTLTSLGNSGNSGRSDAARGLVKPSTRLPGQPSEPGDAPDV